MGAKVRQVQAAKENSTSQLIAKAQNEAREYVSTSDVLEPDGGIESNIIRNAVKFQAKKRVMNVRAIAGHAAEELKDKEVLDHDPDPDWIARFFDGAQDVSSEELQKLWGKILAGEIKSPGQTSLRTLSILRNMTQQEAKNFSALMRFRISGLIFDEGLRMMLGDHSDLMSQMVHFSHIGLLGGHGESENITLRRDGKFILEHHDHALMIEGLPGQQIWRDMVHKISILTRAGLELAKLCQHELDLLYISHFSEFLVKQNCKLKIYTIADQDYKNSQPYGKDIVEPFVDPEERNQQEPDNAE